MINDERLIIQKRITALFLCSFFWVHAQGDSNMDKAAEITQNIYGPSGLNVNFSQLKIIEKLLYDCLSASSYQLKLAAHFLLPELKKQNNEVQEEIERLKNQKKQVPQKLFYKKFILKQQIDHLHQFIISTDITTLQKFLGIAHRSYEIIVKYGKDFFGYTFEPITAEILAEEMLQYIEFERENILYNYKNLISFLHVRKKNPLPKIIDFWNTQDLQDKLLKRAQQLSPEVEVQFEGLLLSFALQGLVMAGGEITIQWYDDDDRKVFEEYQKEQSETGKGWDTFQKKLQKDQKTIFTNIAKAFGNQQKQLQGEYKTSNVRLREALVYLNQSINLDKPIKRYLDIVSLMQLDQHFASSLMYTPKNQPWYNIFDTWRSSYALLTGDCEFDSKNNSFWQNSLVQMPEKLYWKQKKDGDILSQDPSINSIFTEYVPPKLNYDIEIECTLINCQYPFFAGIIFNRGRWISGDPERLRWYRLLGLYGTQEKAKDKATRAINLSFAQQILDIPKGDKGKEKITSPLEQIMTDKTKPLNYALDKKDITFLEANPITFVFKLTNKAGTVLLELDKKTNGTTQKLYSGSVHNLDPYIYLFHGIGFMAVGCQAQFKIIKPAALVYNDTELKNFEIDMKKVK